MGLKFEDIYPIKGPYKRFDQRKTAFNRARAGSAYADSGGYNGEAGRTKRRRGVFLASRLSTTPLRTPPLL